MILNIDADILLYIQNHIRNDVLDPIFKAITHLGDAGIFWIILTLVMLCFKKTRVAGIYSAMALLGSVVLNNLILKNLIHRVRPYEVIEGLTLMVKKATDFSFPSGHTAASFASSVAMCRKIRKPYAVLLILLAGLIAFSRLYIGIHYPTDILGGLVTGIGLGIAANIVGDKIFKNKEKVEVSEEE